MLTAQIEDLSHQNEELTSWYEELTSRYEELTQQHEELSVQLEECKSDPLEVSSAFPPGMYLISTAPRINKCG